MPKNALRHGIAPLRLQNPAVRLNFELRTGTADILGPMQDVSSILQKRRVYDQGKVVEVGTTSICKTVANAWALGVGLVGVVAQEFSSI